MVTYKSDAWKVFGPLGNDSGCLTFSKLGIIYKIKRKKYSCYSKTHNITLLDNEHKT